MTQSSMELTHYCVNNGISLLKESGFIANYLVPHYERSQVKYVLNDIV